MQVGRFHERRHKSEGNANVALGANAMTHQCHAVTAVADEPEKMREDGLGHGGAQRVNDCSPGGRTRRKRFQGVLRGEQFFDERSHGRRSAGDVPDGRVRR